MAKAKNKSYIIFSVIFYLSAFVLMIYGTFFDLDISASLFTPGQPIATLLEYYGQFVYWAMWGPALSIIFVCLRDINGTLEAVNSLLSFVKPIKNSDTKTYKAANTIFRLITSLAAFILCGIGWKKLIENVIKNILMNSGRENLSQGIYFAISFAVAAVSILLARRINKDTLAKLETLAFAGALFGILCKIVEELKPLTERVRFREMVAWSNGFKNSEGLSEGRHSPLTRDMISSTDFSAFTPWYKKGDDLGIYNRADSFPSGHTLYACTTFLSALICESFVKLKKFTEPALCLSTVYVFIMGCSRICTGAHYLTDVSAAAILGYTAFLIIRSVYIKVVEKQSK